MKICPIFLRGLIYMLLAALPPWITWLTESNDKILQGKEVTAHWVTLCLLAANSTYQAILALRCFIDGTAERGRQKKELDESEVTAVAVAIDKPEART